jgi:glycosyltransferase involved in cell wall biosynthesis
MRICLVFYEPQEFGGLEEYATSLAIGLQELDQAVSALFLTWTPPENQYLRRLRAAGVRVCQMPKWLSRGGSDWRTKERLLKAALTVSSPLVYVLGTGRFLVKGGSWRESITSARNWVGGQLMARLIGPDRRPVLGRVLLRWWQLRWRPDLLHLQGYATTLLFAIEWAHGKGIPVVYEEHQTPTDQFDWWRDFAGSVNKAATVVAVSDESARALRTICGVTRPIVVRNPLLPDPLAADRALLEESRHSGQTIRVTTVARLYVTKGLDHLLESVPRVRASHGAVQFKVHGDGPLLDSLMDHAARLGLDGREIFMGAFTSREELSRIMAGTDIFVLPSILEGQPLGLVEAMAYGRPIVASIVGGVPELIVDEVNGLLCKPADVEALAERICRLAGDSALRSRLGKAARESYERSSFQPAAVSAHLLSTYESVLRAEAAGTAT